MIHSEAYTEATRGECGKDFCLSFEYVTHDPCAREKHTKRVRDNDGTLSEQKYQGTRTETGQSMQPVQRAMNWLG